MKTKLLLSTLSISFLLALFLFCYNTSTAQLSAADSLFTQKRDYGNALEKYRILDGTYIEDQMEFSHIKNRIAESLYLYSLQQLPQNPDSSLHYSNAFLDFLKDNSSHLKQSILNKKYWTFRNMICASNATKNFKLASIYEDSLIAAYALQKLPKGLDKHFCFEIIELDSSRAYGYKTYAQGKLDSISYFYEIFKLDQNDEENYKMYSLIFLMKPKSGRIFKPKYTMWYEPTSPTHKRRSNEKIIKGINYKKAHSTAITFFTLNPVVLTDKKS